MKVGDSRILEGFNYAPLKNFSIQTLETWSEELEGNPLGDSPRRYHPLLIPKDPAPGEGWPVVLVLAGFTGNGPNYFNLKTFEANLPQTLDACVSRGEAPRVVYVFCDAMTSWGGSQFINSEGTGRYESFITGSLVSGIRKTLPVCPPGRNWAVVGGSSGGYGALHLVSQRSDLFGISAAIAPDSFFEASLLPEIWSAMPIIEKAGGVHGVRAEIERGRFFTRKESHKVLNVIAMGLCYASDGRGNVEFPIDPRNGKVLPQIWARWTRHDPLEFLRERDLKKINSVYLDVGTRDQFHLQYGTRQIFDVLVKRDVRVKYREFDGTHFDIGDRRPEMWKWLNEAFSDP